MNIGFIERFTSITPVSKGGDEISVNLVQLITQNTYPAAKKESGPHRRCLPSSGATLYRGESCKFT